jgi:hypothetical protein
MPKFSVYTPKVAWDFRTGAYVPERNGLTNPTKTNVDPTPCYAHDKQLVQQLLGQVAASFPIGWPVALNILPHETEAQTNGWASYRDSYSKPPKRVGMITLAAKRIPPHPAVTRYLVAHEYGHLVDYWICKQMGLKEGHHFRDEYAKLRGVKPARYYGPGQWHASTDELIANDFRILIAGAEAEFWPHPGFTRPEDLPQVVEWWANAKAEYSHAG